jgi:REP element-mobilizing transposase RayT
MGKQLELPRTAGWGGKRRNAGRKRASGASPRVPHIRRPVHKGRHPAHVTLRAKHGLPSFRQQMIHRLIADVLRAQRKRAYEAVFRVVHFSIQANHVHLVIEADTEVAATALRTGVSGFAIAFARRLNKMLHRHGSIWADRYHRHDLKTPREARNGLRYVFGNFTHHGEWSSGDGVLDLHASGWVFDGWARAPDTVREADRWRWPVCPPQTWLVKKGYAKHGPLVATPQHP